MAPTKGALHELHRAFPHQAGSIGLGDPRDQQNDAQTAAIYAVIAKTGGDVKAVTYSPSRIALTPVIEYPDQRSAMKTVAEILALGTLEYVEIEPQWISLSSQVLHARGLGLKHTSYRPGSVIKPDPGSPE